MQLIINKKLFSRVVVKYRAYTQIYHHCFNICQQGPTIEFTHTTFDVMGHHQYENVSLRLDDEDIERVEIDERF